MEYKYTKNMNEIFKNQFYFLSLPQMLLKQLKIPSWKLICNCLFSMATLFQLCTDKAHI